MEYWNLFKRVHESIPRTNNFVEAWHNAFSKMLKSHPLVYKLVDWLRKEQVLAAEKVVFAKTGVRHTRKPEYVKLDERLKALIEVYEKNNFEEYFENLSLILDY